MAKLPILFTIPHCSSFVPADLRRLMLLSDKEIRENSDLYTDEIFDVKNTYTIKAKISRLVADPNRAPDDIEMENKLYHDGVVVSTTINGKQIYSEAPGIESIFERVAKYHDTFHADIEMIKPQVRFLIDGHSMWSIGPGTKRDRGETRPDIVLGNREFTTCTRETTQKIRMFFQKKGYSVEVNDPYPGKFVIGYHCKRRVFPGIQIEINASLFMNEKTLHPYKRKIKKLNEEMYELAWLINEKILKKRAEIKY